MQAKAKAEESLFLPARSNLIYWNEESKAATLRLLRSQAFLPKKCVPTFEN